MLSLKIFTKGFWIQVLKTKSFVSNYLYIIQTQKFINWNQECLWIEKSVQASNIKRWISCFGNFQKKMDWIFFQHSSNIEKFMVVKECIQDMTPAPGQHWSGVSKLWRFQTRSDVGLKRGVFKSLKVEQRKFKYWRNLWINVKSSLPCKRDIIYYKLC